MTRPMSIYVASSWKNPIHDDVVDLLRRESYEVYDYRHPCPGNDGFAWEDVDPAWKSWTPEQWKKGLDHYIARRGFNCDMEGMELADCGVLVLPSGRSAHFEAGWFVGQGRRCFVLAEAATGVGEIELMLAAVGLERIVTSRAELLIGLRGEAQAAWRRA